MRGIFLHLVALLVLSACAAGSGRQGTEIVVSGTGPTASVQGGSQVVFAMTVKNAGPADASNIKLIDTVGNQLKLVSITCAASSGATCPAAPSVQMTIPSLPNGGVLVFAVKVELVAGASGTVSNSMSASFAEEINPTGASAAVTATAVSTSTNVAVSGTGPSETLVGGSQAVFVMTVKNTGPNTTGAFKVLDNVGNGLTLTSIVCAGSGGATCPATVGVQTAVDQLPPGGILTFTVTTQVGQNVNGTVSNGLVVSVGTNPSSPSDSFYATANVATAVIDVSGSPPPGPIPVGMVAAFTMQVTNNGPGTAQNLTITNALSAGITASSAITCTASAGASCPQTLGPAMTLSSLAANATLTFTVPFTVNTGTSGQVSDTLTVASTTDPKGNRAATAIVGTGNSNLVVSETSSPTVPAGSNAVFTAVVTNVGPAGVANVTVGYVLSGPAGSVATVTCSAPAGVSCPSSLGASMTVPSIGIGRSVTFTFTVPVPLSADGQGAITNVVTASAVGNGSLTQNVASYSITPINPHNGTYTLFAANGKQYSMVANFDSNTYTITGNGANIQKTFTPDSSGGGFTVSGTMRLRVSTDLIVGGQDFGGGVIPYIAARVFASTLSQLAAGPRAYDLVYFDLPTTGNTTTAATARISGNTLSICKSLTSVTTPANCPPANLQSYTLSINGNTYTATSTGTAAPLSFQLGIVGATFTMLGTNTQADGSQELLIGLPDAAALAGGVTQGSSTSADWITITLTANSYSFTGQLGSHDSATLQTIVNNAGPFSMLTGNRASDNAQIYVMQAYPLSIAFGAPQGAASGLLQVTIP